MIETQKFGEEFHLKEEGRKGKGSWL